MTTALALTASLIGLGGLGWLRASRAMRQLYPPPLPHGPMAHADVDHDPARPTAVVLLDHAGTEVSDFLLPYELLAATERFNVHAVAPQLRPATLTGGLDVMPHLSFDTFAEPSTARPDLIIVPAMQSPDPQVVAWIAEQAGAGAMVLSICSGAEIAARSGVLDGRRATTFWADIDRLERAHPQTKWIRGVRFTHDGPVATSAGITSGIDATLAVIEGLVGAEAMHRAADAIGYCDLRYLDDPAVTQHRVRPSDVIFPLTAAFARRPLAGVVVTDGVDETRLAAALDTFAATLATRTVTAGTTIPTVTTRHGLTLLPRTELGQLDPETPLLVPQPLSEQASDPTGRTVWQSPAGGRPYTALYEAVACLAAAHGRPVGRFAAKRLELRQRLDLDDSPGWPTTLARLAAGRTGRTP